MQSGAVDLYELRKETLKKLLLLDSYVEHLNDCPNCIIKSSKRAISFCDNIQEAWNFENAPHDVNSNAGVGANAALAWLGGGAVAAGGGGMAAGAGILGMMGPVGWTIASLAGGVIAVKSVQDRKKNKKQIHEIKEKISVIQEDLYRKKEMYSRLSDIISHTEIINSKLDLVRLKRLAKDSFSNNDYPHLLLFEYVHCAKFAGKLSKESININFV